MAEAEVEDRPAVYPTLFCVVNTNGRNTELKQIRCDRQTLKNCLMNCAVLINIHLKWGVYSKTSTPFRDGEYLEKPKYFDSAILTTNSDTATLSILKHNKYSMYIMPE